MPNAVSTILTIEGDKEIFRMKTRTKRLVGIASVLSAGLLTGTLCAQQSFRGGVDLGFSASESSYSNSPGMSDYQLPSLDGTAPASPPASPSSPKAKDVALNNHFDSFEIEPPTGIGGGMNYAGDVYGDYSYGLKSVQNGLLPAERKSLGRFFADGWVTGSAYDHNEWPVTHGFDENTEGRNSSVSPYQLSQAYVTMGREIEYADHFAVGGRIDALYGTDYLMASSLGLETENVTSLGAAASNVYMSDPHWNKNSRGGHPDYGLAVPQAYAEFYAPVMAGLSAKVGHFYSPMGYESICSPNNFFHTHSYTMLYGQPQTVTGAVGKLRFGNRFSLMGGAHQGWNVFDDNNDSWDVIAGFALDGEPGSSFTFLVSTGDSVVDNLYNRRTHDFVPVNGRQTSYSMVLQKRLCPELTWVLEHDLGVAENGAFSVDRNFRVIRDDGYWYSVVNYLYLTLAPTLDFGARAEWFCDQNHTRLLGGEATSMQLPGIGYDWTGENVFDISLGLNWRPTQFVTIRPEVRWDYSDIQMTDLNGNVLKKGIYDSFSDDNRLTFGGDVIVHF